MQSKFHKVTKYPDAMILTESQGVTSRPGHCTHVIKASTNFDHEGEDTLKSLSGVRIVRNFTMRATDTG